METVNECECVITETSACVCSLLTPDALGVLNVNKGVGADHVSINPPFLNDFVTPAHGPDSTEHRNSNIY